MVLWRGVELKGALVQIEAVMVDDGYRVRVSGVVDTTTVTLTGPAYGRAQVVNGECSFDLARPGRYLVTASGPAGTSGRSIEVRPEETGDDGGGASGGVLTAGAVDAGTQGDGS